MDLIESLPIIEKLADASNKVCEIIRYKMDRNRTDSESSDEEMDQVIAEKIIEVCDGICDFLERGGFLIIVAKHIGRHVSNLIDAQYVIAQREMPEEVMAAMFRVNMKAFQKGLRPLIVRSEM